MSEPFVTVLQEIADAPDTFSPYVVASWCGKASKHIEQQQAEIERLKAVVEAAKKVEQGEYCADGYRNCSVNEDDLRDLRKALAALDEIGCQNGGEDG